MDLSNAIANQFSDQKTITSTTGTTLATQITTKTTSTAANGNDINGGLNLLTGVGVSYDSGANGTQTTSYSSLLSNTSSTVQQLTDQIQAAMTIQDTSGLTIPARVVWDTTFLGIAAEDTNLNFTCDLNQLTAAAARTPTEIPPQLRNVPVVSRGQSSAALRQNGIEPLTYGIQAGNTYLLVQKPRSSSESATQQRAARLDASERHVAMAVTPPPSPTVGILSPHDALIQLSRLKSKEQPALNAMRHLQSALQTQ